MDICKIRLSDIVKFTLRISFIFILITVLSGFYCSKSACQNYPDQTNSTITQISPENLNLTQAQTEVIRSFLINNANKIPDLNLNQQQIDAIVSYFDNIPSVNKVNLTQQQTEIIRSYIISNFSQIANSRLSDLDFNTIISIIRSNPAGIASLLLNNPEITALARSILPQIYEFAATNQQIGAIITLLRTIVPGLNTVLSI